MALPYLADPGLVRHGQLSIVGSRRLPGERDARLPDKIEVSPPGVVFPVTPDACLPISGMRPQNYTFVLASLVAVGGCDRQSSVQPEAELAVAAEAVVSAVPPPAAAPAASSPLATSTRQLTRVDDVSEVCMVNNQFMGRAQIPVVVEGKTYFGCCEMCKGRLAKDATARVAKDPVSGNDVDKSSAVIAKREDGQVIYFENAQNLERFQAGAK